MGTASGGFRRGSAVGSFRWVIGALGLLLMLAAALPAAAEPTKNGTSIRAALSSTLPVDGKWHSFGFETVGSTTDTLDITSTSTVLLRVTDLACRGDQFEIVDGSTVIGQTDPVRVDRGCDQGPFIINRDAAFDSATYSHGTFLLPPGDHEISFNVLASPFGGGGAALSASACSVVGTADPDVLAGSSEGDFICSAGGADSISAGTGADNVYAGPGNDSVMGGSEADRIEGEAAPDVLTGRGGDDRVVGGPGPDAVLGGTGADVVIGGAYSDLIRGGSGNDVLDAVDGVGGNDVVVGGPGKDLCRVDGGDRVRGCEQVQRFAPVKKVSRSESTSTIDRLRQAVKGLGR